VSAPRKLVLVVLVACGSADPPAPAAPRAGPAPVDAGVAADASLRAHPGSDYGTKHITFDDVDGGMAPVNHTELLWGEYIDRRGRAAIGWHSHDPVTGNAR
jgi:hypothetical protein